MAPSIKRSMEMTAADLMSDKVVDIPVDLSFRSAARLLSMKHMNGAPVVDVDGGCLDDLSCAKFLRACHRWRQECQVSPAPRVKSCPFQEFRRDSDGVERTHCSLPMGICPVQRMMSLDGNDAFAVCSDPNGVFVDWQLVILEKIPSDCVRRHMNRCPVTTGWDRVKQRYCERANETPGGTGECDA